jgi:oligopeptide transport system ATP-binding protein
VTELLLHVEHLSKEFTAQHGVHGMPSSNNMRPVHNVSFDLHAGEIVALVGQAGAGKSTLTRTLAMLMRPQSGKVVFEGRDLTRQGEGALRPIRRRLQVLFSDPRTALNPANLVSEVMFEPLRVQRLGTPEQQMANVKSTLRQVGLNSLLLERRLTALSAGERQRVALARLLTLNPALIVCDDPALTLPPLAADQFFKLMADVRQRNGTAFLWMVSSFKPAAAYADRLGVLYEGRLVETGPASDLLQTPRHPYAQQIFGGASPPPAPFDPFLKGCPYHWHCPHVMDVCRQRMPDMVAVSDSQQAACFLYTDEKTLNAGANPRG